MRVLYNIGVLFLGLSIRLASVANEKAKKWVLGRKNFFKDLPQIDKSKNLVWFHCASLGEFDQGLPLMNALKEQQGDLVILVTFFSPSGMEHYHKRDHKADIVLYLPLDTPSNARRFVNYFSPESAFFVKYEFWSNYIFALKKEGAKIYNVSGNFRNDHRFFKWYGGFFRKTLKQFNHFFVQNNSSKELLASIGINNVTVTGDSRYDKVMETKKNLVPDEKLAGFCSDQKVFIVGSSWPKDEELILPFINNSNEKVIIAPHNIDTKHIEDICSKLKRPFVRYTELEKIEHQDAEILILDTIGHLASAYSFGRIAYVGGGFSGSLHNILEPAVFGIPVIFGPKHKRFPEADQFIREGFGFSVQDISELNSAVKLINDNYDQLSERESQFVQEHSGVSRKILSIITSN